MAGTQGSARPPHGPGRRAILVGGAAVLGVTAAVTWRASGDDTPRSVRVIPPTEAVIAAGDPATSALAVSRALFASSPSAVVVAPGLEGTALTDATALATQAGVPCLVDGDGLAEELDRLGCDRLVRRAAEGTDPGWSDAVTDRDEVEALPAGEDRAHPVVVVARDLATHAAAVATVRGALGSGKSTRVLQVTDPRADPVVAAVRADPAPALVLVGDHPHLPAAALAGAAHMAMTAPQLPGGGVLPFPGRRMVALYGHPDVPGLGVLGEQDIQASVERAREIADQYAELVDEEVVPAFEIITTIASTEPGADGDYSNESDPETIRPWVDAAAEAGIYVVLDLQPGRADFLSQAKRFEDLLLEPHVGLALDPEWRLGPDQRPLQQVGHVKVDEVNEVAGWLARLTRDHGLPQKVLTLHQFQTQMIRDRGRLRVDLPELVTLVHVDGHGTPSMKQETWTTIAADLPEGVRLGWKNFYDEDSPMLTPRETVEQVEPVPWFVSYQ